MTKISVLLVTKGNTDGSIIKGDRLYYTEDGSLVDQNAKGWLEKDELTPDITDFEAIEDPEYIVLHMDNGSYHMVSKKELEE